ncbi:MAG: aminotransferase class IV [Alphaproteobacteria bacterium]|nr:aminotransferase class IV [Alphaproteobacteria bacterium]
MNPSRFIYLNGQYLPESEALIPVADRGFRFGDGLFETIRIHHAVPYQWEFHMQRLSEGLAALHITCNEDWAAATKGLLQKNMQTDGFIRISISRGVGSRGYRPHPQTLTPTIVMESLRDMSGPKDEYNLWVSNYTKPSLSALPVNHKIAQGLNSTLALLEAEEHHCEEAILLSQDGKVCEAASANILWLKDGTLYTPDLKTGCLRGSTRETIMRLADVKTALEPLDSLKSAEALWIINGRIGIHPVQGIKPLNIHFADHAMTETLKKLWRSDIENYTHAHREAWQ